MTQKNSQVKLTAFQKNLIKLAEQSSFISSSVKKMLPFDCPYTNDFCSAKNGKRTTAMAWKSANQKMFNVYCDICGSLESFSKEEFQDKKMKMSHEEALSNMEKANKKKEGSIEP